jgi:hypothetical protein
MTGLSGNIGRTLAAVMVVGGIVVAQAGVAAANSNCDSYAKLTLQQVKRAIALRCGYSGPRWSLDVSRHRAWCQEVGPAGWRAELKIRDQMLARCKS